MDTSKLLDTSSLEKIKDYINGTQVGKTFIYSIETVNKAVWFTFINDIILPKLKEGVSPSEIIIHAYKLTSGWGPSGFFYIKEYTDSVLRLESIFYKYEINTSGNGVKKVSKFIPKIDLVTFVINNGKADNISTNQSVSGGINYLDTTCNYATPYEPLYPGSPATKKYVDDSVLAASGLQILDATDAANPIDFNDYTEPGTMYLVKGNNFTNGPSTTRSEWGDWGYLINNNKPEVQKKLYQTYVTVPYCFTNGGLTINHNMYCRSKSTNTTTATWSIWSERDPLTSDYSKDWMNELRDVIGLSQRGAYNMYKELTTTTGTLQNLGTTDKTSLVNAINELNSKIGDINSILETMTDVEGANE